MIESLRSPDSVFFDAIHSLLEAQRAADTADDDSERRGARRSSFQHEQLLAPYDGKRLPRHADFRIVQCRDLSPSGFSFVSPTAPATPQVVIALGVVPFSFFTAQIVRREPVDNGPGVLVGCKLLARV